MTVLDDAYYVYGITQGDTKPTVAGIANARLELVEGNGVAALVSRLPRGEVRLGREEMLAHSRVLEAAITKGTVLPMRFGVVMSGTEEIRQRLLDDHAADLRTQLEEFRDKIEIRIRATYEEAALLREVVHEDSRIDALRRSLGGRSEDATYFARIALGERVAEGIERKRERDGAAIIATLAPAVLAVDQGQPSHERVALTASFLVERARIGEFDERLERFAAASAGSIRFKYTGPLPPHSFVQLVGST